MWGWSAKKLNYVGMVNKFFHPPPSGFQMEQPLASKVPGNLNENIALLHPILCICYPPDPDCTHICCFTHDL